MKKTIRPFSNGTQSMVWYERNCDHCARACKLPELPDLQESAILVEEGKECMFKYMLDVSHISGEIEEIYATQMGWVKSFAPKRCSLFRRDVVENNDDITYVSTDPNQLKFDF